LFGKIFYEENFFMLRTFPFLMGVVCLMMVLSCASTGEQFTQTEANEAFEEIYNTFRSSLILEGAKQHLVTKGDTLSAITRNNYGTSNGYYFPLIMLASSEVVLDPDLIEPGMLLTIPDLQKNLNNAKARAQIKKFLIRIAGVYDKKGDEKTRDRLKDLAVLLD
jgi:hypothetical protein